MSCNDIGILTPSESTTIINTALANYYTKTEIDNMIDYTTPLEG
jgi:hypothetical protein